MRVVILFIIGLKDMQITTFRATVLVKRAEDWWVEAESLGGKACGRARSPRRTRRLVERLRP